MAWAFAQRVTRATGSGSSQTGVQFSSVTTAGNTLLAVCSWSTGGAGSTFSDSEGNTYTVRKEINDATNIVSLAVASAIGIVGGTLSSITCSFKACSSQFNVIGVAEYSGLGAFDVAVGQASTGSTGTNAVTSSVVTPTGSTGALLFGAYVDVSGSTNTVTAGTGYTIRGNINYGSAGNNAQAIAFEDQKQATVASTAARFTQKASHSYLCSLIVIDLPAAGGGIRNPWSMMMMGA